MLLELWAYACEITALYDEVIANECYLRTARLDPSVRKLVGLLGYRPRPAVAARVGLAVTADTAGRLAVTLPTGAGARSGAFAKEPPQLFELPRVTSVHPLANRWQLEAPRRLTAGDPTDTVFSSLYLDPVTARVKDGELVLIQVVDDGSLTQISRVSKVEPVTAADGDDYVQVTFAAPVTLNATPVARVRMYRVNERIGLWSIIVAASANPAAIVNTSASTTLTLDGLYRQVHPEDTVLVSRDGVCRWFTVSAVEDKQMEVVGSKTVQVPANGSTAANSFVMPPIYSTATRVTLDALIDRYDRGDPSDPFTPTWSTSAPTSIQLHYGLTEVGRVVVPAESTVSPTGSLRLREPVEEPPDGWRASRFILVDKNGTAVDAQGSIDYSTRALTLTDADEWTAPLMLPVDVYGNIVTFERGETVPHEILGNGNGSAVSQEFVLKKSPLTYLPVTALDGSPQTSTLEVWVDDIRWTEVKTFYGAAPDASVYVVRQDDDGNSHVRFGDGVLGRRLPSGTRNVRARYRFGGGRAAPPTGSVSQLAKPIPGVKGWSNPQPAFGGDNAEPASKVRRYAPRSALVLGRAVSLADIEAVAASVGGARAVRADWYWDDDQQRPVARVWYIGLPGVSDLIAEALRSVCDPSMPVDVAPAIAIPSALTIDAEIDARHDGAKVAAAVLARLLAAEEGLLTPERVGIARPLVRSRLFADILDVDGTVSVRGLLLRGNSIDVSVSPGTGQYFDFETGSVTVNGVEA
jgi:hypothetical protein